MYRMQKSLSQPTVDTTMYYIYYIWYLVINFTIHSGEHCLFYFWWNTLAVGVGINIQHFFYHNTFLMKQLIICKRPTSITLEQKHHKMKSLGFQRSHLWIISSLQKRKTINDWRKSSEISNRPSFQPYGDSLAFGCNNDFEIFRFRFVCVFWVFCVALRWVGLVTSLRRFHHSKPNTKCLCLSSLVVFHDHYISLRDV